MNRKHQAILLGAVLAILAMGARAADGQSINFDANTDFTALRTFAIREGRLATSKPEIDNRLFRQRLENSIRATLTSKGLKEVAQGADLSVTYAFNDADFSVLEMTQPVLVPGGANNPATVIPGGPRGAMFTEGTLVIDLRTASDAVVWHGTYHDREASGPTLSRNLSTNARKLLSKYPPKQKAK